MKKLAIIAFTALGLAACGSGRKNAAENAKQAAEDPALQDKSFKSECKLGSTKVLEGLLKSITNSNVTAPKSYRVEYNFTGAEVTRKTVSYENVNCSGDELLAQSEVGSIKVNAKDVTNDGAKQLKMVFDKLEVTAPNDKAVAFANAVKVCGENTWKAKEPKNESAKAQEEGCYGGAKLGDKNTRTVYSVYKVDGDKLLLNPETMSEMKAENERPNSLQGATEFKILK